MLQANTTQAFKSLTEPAKLRAFLGPKVHPSLAQSWYIALQHFYL
jgi:hypothetical protein